MFRRAASTKSKVVLAATALTLGILTSIAVAPSASAVLPACTKNWTGTTSTNWNTATNWSGSALPISSDVVCIDGSLSNQPILPTGTVTVANVITSNAGTLSVTSYTANLTINGESALDNLVLTGGARFNVNNQLTVANVFDLTGSAVVAGSGTIVASGTTTFDYNGGTDFKINFQQAAGTVNWAQGNIDNTSHTFALGNGVVFNSTNASLAGLFSANFLINGGTANLNSNSWIFGLTTMNNSNGVINANGARFNDLDQSDGTFKTSTNANDTTVYPSTIANYTHSGGVLKLRVQNASDVDALTISGTQTLSGTASLEVNALSTFAPAASSNITLISGTRTGTYATATINQPTGVNTTLAYVAGLVRLSVPAANTVPGAPTVIGATGGNASASIAFTPPTSDGGSAITGYTVTATPGGVTATGTSSPITMTGLTNGTGYTFTVLATNSVGNSAQSSASATVTPIAPTTTTTPPTTTAPPSTPAATAGSSSGYVLNGNQEPTVVPSYKESPQPVVGVAPTPSGTGAWTLASDGGVFATGTAQFFGSMGGTKLNAPAVALSSSTSGNGYWLGASDGGVFAFGDAKFAGSMGGAKLNAPVTGIAAACGNSGYYLVASDGGVFAFGGAPFYGSMGDKILNQPIVSLTPTCGGYYLLGADGGVFAFGTARFFGNSLLDKLPHPEALIVTASGSGYWIADRNGTLKKYGV